MSEAAATNRHNKKFAQKALFIIIMVAAGLILAFALYNIYSITSEDSANEHTMEAMRQFVMTANEQTGDTVNPDDIRTIDFEALHEVNPEIVGWLYIPGTTVDYPVTQTDNDSYYLSHGPDLEENRAGSLFFETACSPDLYDINTIIYGHRMNNGSMFGSMSDFEDPSYFNDHRIAYVYTQDGARHEYEFFTILHSSDSMDAPAYRLGYDDPADFVANCESMMDASIVPVDDVTISANDKILTLSTCIRGDGDSRLVLQAKKVS